MDLTLDTPPHGLPRRQLSPDIPNVSIIGLGTVKLGRSQGVKYPTPVTIPTDDDAIELLATAKDLGVNLIDTAPAYGESESRLGKLLRSDRGSWVIATKVGEVFEDGVSRFDFSREGIFASVDKSLARLHTTYVDALILHSDGFIEENLVNNGIVDALLRVKAGGKARAIGASTKTLQGALHALEHLDCVMVTLNPSALEDLPAIEKARMFNKGVLIKKVFGSGHLAHTPQGRQDCLQLALSTQGITSVVIGTTNPAHLAAAAADAIRFA